MLDRRTFLQLSTPVVLALPLSRFTEGDFKPRLKTSCNFYSFNQQITSGNTTTAEAIDFCAQIGFDGVDITGYYFSDYPTVPDDEEIFGIKNLVIRHGMEITGTGVRNDFAQEDEEAVAADFAMVEEWIEVAAKLGAPMLRIFAGKKLKEGQSRQKAVDQVFSKFRTCIELGRKHGVMITYQNHNDVFLRAAEVKEIMDELEDPWFGLNLDIGSLRTGDPYEEIETLIPYANTWQIKEYVYRNGEKEKVNLKKLASIIKASSYQGFLPLETLAPSDPWTELPVFLKSLESELGLT